MSEPVRAGLLGVTVLVMVTLCLCHRYLPMNDAPSHIANAVILRGLWQGDPYFAAHYQVQALPLPYWMAALLQIGLQTVLPPLLAWAVLCAAYVILMPLSFLYLCRVAAPENRAYAVVAALAAFNWAYFLGEINFILGQPCFLLAYALFLRLGQPEARTRTLGAFALASGAVYLCHIYALTALCVALGVYTLLRLASRRAADDPPRGPPLQRRQWLALALTASEFLLAGYFVFLQHGTRANRGALGFDLSLRKAAHLLIDPLDSPLAAPGAKVRWLLLALVLGLLALPLLCNGRRAARLPLLLPALALLLLAYLGPDHISRADGTVLEAEIATRFTLSGFLLLLAGLRLPALPSPRVRGALLALLSVLAVVKLSDAYRLHRDVDQRLRVVSAQVLARIPLQQRVLPLMDRPGAVMSDYLYHRLGNYVVVERHGYSPHVFAVLGQHALRHRRWGDYREVDDRVVRPEEWAYYDYVLIQTERSDPQVPGLREHADLVVRAAGFALYRVRRA